MVSAIVLSNCESSLMGRPIALLKIGEKTFLQHIVDVLHSARVLDIAVVLGAETEEIRKDLSWFSGKVVVNHFSRLGQMSSILAGMHVLEQKVLHGVLICPINQPLLTQALLVGMLNQFWIKHRPVVVPVYKGRWGYPILIGKALFPEMEKSPPDSNVSTILSSHPDHVLGYQTEDEGVVLSINSQEDYQKMIVKRFSKDRV